MQKLEKSQEKTQKILDNLKKELNELIELNNSNDKEFDKIRKIIKEMTEELKKVEENIEKNKNIISYETEEDMQIKKKVTIKNKKKSKSFINWIFNNKEL